MQLRLNPVVYTSLFRVGEIGDQSPLPWRMPFRYYPHAIRVQPGDVALGKRPEHSPFRHLCADIAVDHGRVEVRRLHIPTYPASQRGGVVEAHSEARLEAVQYIVNKVPVRMASQRRMPPGEALGQRRTNAQQVVMDRSELPRSRAVQRQQIPRVHIGA